MEFLCDRPENFFIATNRMLKYTNAPQTPFVYLRINCSWSNEVYDRNRLTLLSVSVDAADALFNTHGIPRQIVVDQEITKLEVQTFTPDLRGEENFQRCWIFLRQ